MKMRIKGPTKSKNEIDVDDPEQRSSEKYDEEHKKEDESKQG